MENKVFDEMYFLRSMKSHLENYLSWEKVLEVLLNVAFWEADRLLEDDNIANDFQFPEFKVIGDTLQALTLLNEKWEKKINPREIIESYISKRV